MNAAIFNLLKPFFKDIDSITLYFQDDIGIFSSDHSMALIEIYWLEKKPNKFVMKDKDEIKVIKNNDTSCRILMMIKSIQQMRELIQFFCEHTTETCTDHSVWSLCYRFNN